MMRKKHQGKRGLPPIMPRPETVSKEINSPLVKMQFDSADDIKRRLK